MAERRDGGWAETTATLTSPWTADDVFEELAHGAGDAARVRRASPHFLRAAAYAAWLNAVAYLAVSVSVPVAFAWWDAGTLFHVGVARVVLWVNVGAAAMSAYCGLLAWRHRSVGGHGDDRLIDTWTLALWVLSASNLLHTQVTGTSHSMIPGAEAATLAVASWVVPWPRVLPLFFAWAGGYAVLVGLEQVGVLPYASLLIDTSGVSHVLHQPLIRAGTFAMTTSLVATTGITVLTLRGALATQRVELEALLRERNGDLRVANAQLRTKVEELTDSNDQLLATERELSRRRTELEHVARVGTLSEFTSSIAHELNQPLAAIRTTAQALDTLARDGEPLDAEARASLGWIVQDSQRASDVLSRLRSLVRRAESVREPVDLADVARQVLAITGGELRRAHVVVHLSLADGTRVRGDSVQLSQVLLNLVTNALHALHDVLGQRQLWVSVEATPTHVVCSVRDGGHGLASPERVFEPFFTTKERGLGIGLPLCRTLIDAHGGTLTARNTDAGGALLQFAIPRLEEPT